MAATKRAVSSDYSHEMLRKMKANLDDEQLCDVVLIAGADGKRISAHRLILSANSDYFKSIFTGDMKEENKKEITIKEMKGKALQELVSYCYTGELNLQDDNVEMFLLKSRQLHLSSAVRLCCQYLSNQLTPSNCLSIHVFAEKNKCTDLRDLTQRFICKYIKKVAQSEEFFQLTVDQLGKLLSRDDLKVTLEEDIFRCIMSWVQRDESNRKKHLPQLLPHIRLQFMDPQFISEHVENVYKDNGCIALIGDAYIHKLNKRTYIGSSFLLGCDPKGKFGKYCPELNTWTPIDAMNLNRKYCSFTLWDDKLIALGEYLTGGKTVNTVQYWNVEKMSWMEISALGTERYCLGLVILEGSIYAVGGDNGQLLSSVERLDSLSSSWKSVASLPFEFQFIRVVAFDKHIYVSGKNNCSSHLYRYDPNTNIWTNLGTSSGYIRSFIVADGDLFAFKGQTLQLYNKNSNTWTIYINDCPEVRASCILGDRIFTVVSENNSFHLKEFDLDRKVFTYLTPLFSKGSYEYTNIFFIKDMQLLFSTNVKS